MIITEQFKNFVDDLVGFADYDQELKDAIKWMDLESQKKQVSFYEFVYILLTKFDAEKKAEMWAKHQ